MEYYVACPTSSRRDGTGLLGPRADAPSRCPWPLQLLFFLKVQLSALSLSLSLAVRPVQPSGKKSCHQALRAFRTPACFPPPLSSQLPSPHEHQPPSPHEHQPLPKREKTRRGTPSPGSLWLGEVAGQIFPYLCLPLHPCRIFSHGASNAIAGSPPPPHGPLYHPLAKVFSSGAYSLLYASHSFAALVQFHAGETCHTFPGVLRALSLLAALLTGTMAEGPGFSIPPSPLPLVLSAELPAGCDRGFSSSRRMGSTTFGKQSERSMRTCAVGSLLVQVLGSPLKLWGGTILFVTLFGGARAKQENANPVSSSDGRSRTCFSFLFLSSYFQNLSFLKDTEKGKLDGNQQTRRRDSTPKESQQSRPSKMAREPGGFSTLSRDRSWQWRLALCLCLSVSVSLSLSLSLFPGERSALAAISRKAPATRVVRAQDSVRGTGGEKAAQKKAFFSLCTYTCCSEVSQQPKGKKGAPVKIPWNDSTAFKPGSLAL